MSPAAICGKRNFATTLKLPLAATLTPPRLLHLDDRIGRLAPGCNADLVHLSETLDVAGVWMGGRRAEELPAPN